MDNYDIPELDSIDTTLPDIDLDGTLTMEDVHYYLTINSTPEKVNAALKANHTLLSEKISVRVPHHVLSELKASAKQSGIGYQTLINLIFISYLTK